MGWLGRAGGVPPAVTARRSCRPARLARERTPRRAFGSPDRVRALCGPRAPSARIRTEDLALARRVTADDTACGAPAACGEAAPGLECGRRTGCHGGATLPLPRGLTLAEKRYSLSHPSAGGSPRPVHRTERNDPPGRDAMSGEGFRLGGGFSIVRSDPEARPRHLLPGPALVQLHKTRAIRQARRVKKREDRSRQRVPGTRLEA